MASDCNFRLDNAANGELVKCLGWIVELYRLGQKNTADPQDSEIFQQILEHVVSGFNADSGSLAFLTNENKELELVAGIDLPPGVIGSTVAVGECRMGTVIQSSKPMLMNGDLSQKNTDKNTTEKQSSNRRVSSAMCWPIIGEQFGVVGALNINRGNSSNAYTESDLEAGRTLIEMISVVLENTRLHRDYNSQINELEQMNAQIKAVNEQLEAAQNQLLQSEKMASVGQLAAGVAHEINNPVGYINSNVATLKQYASDLFDMLDAYAQLESSIENKDKLKDVEVIKEKIDLKYLREDIVELIGESLEGLTRVKQIVQDLKDFSHVDGGVWEWADLQKGLDSTLNVASNELKYKAEVVKKYGGIPQVECMPSQLNQVFMNILVNAAHAIETRGQITISTGEQGDEVYVSIQDTGSGMSEEIQKRIFEPFYTTKAVGTGTGLGLSLSYGIVEKHGGRIDLHSDPGKGTTFTVWLPIQQNEHRAAG